MTLTIELTPQEETWLAAQAAQQGLQPTEIVRRLIDRQLPSVTPPHENSGHVVSAIDAKNASAIAMLQSWLDEDATDDPEAIRQAEAELEELKQNLNANRAATGERLVFP